MEHETTLKQFFKLDKETFEKELEKKLNSYDTTFFDFSINGKKPFFNYNHFIFEKVIKIETKNVQLNSIFQSLPQIAKKQYIRNTMVAEVKNTNELEGVFSSRKEIFELTEDLKKRKSYKIGSIVNKYMMLLQDEGEKEIASCKDIRRIYDNLFDSFGESLISEKPDGVYFRKDFVGVYDGLGKLVHKGIVGENTIIEIIQNALSFLNNEEVNLFLRLAIFHYIFEFVHPFYDGNGRVGRYIISSLIKKEKSDVFAFRVSSGINAQKNKYYKAFENTEDTRNYADLGTFVYSFLDIFEHEYDASIKYAIEKRDLMNELNKKYIDNGHFKSKSEKAILFILIQAHVFSDFGVSVSDLKDATDLSDKTVRRALESLQDNNMIKEERMGKTIFYNLSQNIDLV